MKVTVTNLTPDFALWHHSLNSALPSPCTMEDGTCTLFKIKVRNYTIPSSPNCLESSGFVNYDAHFQFRTFQGKPGFGVQADLKSQVVRT